MQLDDLQCWDLAFVWAQLQFNQMQKYVDCNLYTIETSLAGQRWEPHVKGGATDSCHKICHCHLIFPVERRLQSSEYHLDMSLRTWDLLLGVGGFIISRRLFTVYWGYLDTGGEAPNTQSVPCLCSHGESALLCPFPAWRCYVDVKSHSVNDARIWKAARKYLDKCSVAAVRLQCILQLYRKINGFDSELNLSLSFCVLPRTSRDGVLPVIAGSGGEG